MEILQNDPTLAISTQCHASVLSSEPACLLNPAASVIVAVLCQAAPTCAVSSSTLQTGLCFQRSWAFWIWGQPASHAMQRPILICLTSLSCAVSFWTNTDNIWSCMQVSDSIPPREQCGVDWQEPRVQAGSLQQCLVLIHQLKALVKKWLFIWHGIRLDIFGVGWENS